MSKPNDVKNTETGSIVENVIFKCCECYKVFTTKRSLVRHMGSTSCKKIRHPNECSLCNNTFPTASAKSHHMKVCRIDDSNDTNPSVSVHTQNIQTQNNIQTQQIINNNYLTLNFGKDDITFLRDHISPDQFRKIWDRENLAEAFTEYSDALLERPENRLVKKSNLRCNYSSVHVGDGEWKMKHDKDVFPRLTFELSCNAKVHATENKKTLRSLEKTTFGHIWQYLDDVNVEDPNCCRTAIERIRIMIADLSCRLSDVQELEE